MKRAAEEKALAKRQLKVRQDNLTCWNEGREIPSWARQLGRYRKKKALACRNPRCMICHSDKFPKREPTRQEIQATGD
jgi:hypothetical protein